MTGFGAAWITVNTLSNSFLEKVFKFFGFAPTMKKWFSLLTVWLVLCAWIARAAKLQIDNWRSDLRFSALAGNVLAVWPCNLDPDVNPILHNFSKSYENFYREYRKKMIITRKHLFSLFLHLPGLRLPDMVQLLDHQFFAENMHIRFRTLKFCDCFVGNRLKSTEEFQVDGIQLTAACWMQLQTALFSARNRLHKKAKLIMSVNQLICFLKNLKKCQKNLDLSWSIALEN